MACLIYPPSPFVPSRSVLSLISSPSFSYTLHFPSRSPLSFRSPPSCLSFCVLPSSLCVAFRHSTYLCLPFCAPLSSPVYLFFRPLHFLQPLLLPLYCSMTTSLVSFHCLVFLFAPSLSSTCSLFSVLLSHAALSTSSALHTCYSHLSLSLSLRHHSISFLSSLFPSLTLSLSSLLSVPRLLFCTPLFLLPPHVHSALFFVCFLCHVFTFYLPPIFSIYPLSFTSTFSPQLMSHSNKCRCKNFIYRLKEKTYLLLFPGALWEPNLIYKFIMKIKFNTFFFARFIWK